MEHSKEYFYGKVDIGGSDQEQSRLNRIFRVFEFYKLCHDRFNDYNDSPTYPLVSLYDNKGNLHAIWKTRLEDDDINIKIIELAWELEHECTIVHGLLTDGSSKLVTRELSFREINF